METSKPKSFFRIYVAIMLTVCVLLLAGVLGFLIYGGLKLKSESQTVTNKVNSFNGQVKQINNNLQNIDQQLQGAKAISGLKP